MIPSIASATSIEVANDATYSFPLFLIAAALFSPIALGHAIRLLFGWHVMIENVVLPSATI